VHKPYAKPVGKALADIRLHEPRISKSAFILIRILGRLYLFLFYGIARILLRGEKDMFYAFKRALEGDSRCIIAFRHPNGGEPQLLTWFFLFRLRALARRQGVKLKRHPHAVFIYGYEVVRWGGWVARFILPNVGAMPIHHTKMDKQGMARIYKSITEGRYPVALAPEGQVSYTIEGIPRLEQGVIRIGFNAAERLASKGNKAPVEILPVAIHFRFGSYGAFTIELLIRKIEKYTSAGKDKAKEKRKLPFSKRMEIARTYILEINEKRYGIKADKNQPFEQRLDAVINAALETAERILNLKTQGEYFSRMYTLRQACWDRIVLPGYETLDNMTGLERGTADLLAGEAWHAGRHVELIDLSWYLRNFPIPADDAPLHIKVEFVQNLWDFINRSIGGAYSNRLSILPRRVIIQSSSPINLSSRLADYRQDKNKAIRTAMTDLQNAYLDCINKVNQSE